MFFLKKDFFLFFLSFFFFFFFDGKSVMSVLCCSYCYMYNNMCMFV